jgi:hypothetical protein
MSLYRPEQAYGDPDFLDVRHYEGGRSSDLRTGRLHSQEFSWYSFLEAESTPGHIVPSLASEKIPSDTTGDRSPQCLNDYATPGSVIISIKIKLQLRVVCDLAEIRTGDFPNNKSLC